MSKTIHGTFKFRIKWSASRDAWVLQTECRAFRANHWDAEEPAFNIAEIVCGFRAMYRHDSKKVYWSTIDEGQDVEQLRAAAQKYVDECVERKRAAIAAEKRGEENRDVHHFVLTASVDA